jgi:acyl-CoA synthetase (AMP-forming)/AMP-acid ligase II
VDVGTLLDRTVRHHRRRPAVIDGDRVLDYGALDDRTNRLANALLGLGLRRGDRVLDLQHNAHTYIETDLAMAKAGLVRVAVNYRLTTEDWAYIAEDCAARALVYGEGFGEAAGALIERVGGFDVVVGVERGPGHAYEALLGAASASSPEIRLGPDEVVSLNYSSGTTGRPKGCMRTLRNRLASARDVLVDLTVGLGPDDRWLHAGPITHASGLFVLPHVVVGASQVVMAKFEPDEVLDLLEQQPVTGIVLVPTMLERVVAREPSRRDLSRLRRVAYAGAPMQPERIALADVAFEGRLVQFYGMVEAIPPVTVLSPADHHAALTGDRPAILGSAGRACMGAQLDVVDEQGVALPDGEHGELVISGDHVMAGYWGMADETGKALRDGRLWTGDLAWRDDEGYVTIIDRKNDMIITGGYNVYPREVEEVIAGDPTVSAVAVVGVADPDWGQAVTAVVVAKPGADIDLADLDGRCRQQLAPFKRPKRIEPVDVLPITSAGKINRKAVRASLEEQVSDGR